MTQEFNPQRQSNTGAYVPPQGNAYAAPPQQNVPYAPQTQNKFLEEILGTFMQST